jgi:hypothetical protein
MREQTYTLIDAVKYDDGAYGFMIMGEDGALKNLYATSRWVQLQMERLGVDKLIGLRIFKTPSGRWVLQDMVFDDRRTFRAHTVK